MNNFTEMFNIKYPIVQAPTDIRIRVKNNSIFLGNAK